MRARAARGAELRRGLAEPGQVAADFGEVVLADRRQRDRAVAAHEQRHLQVRLERLDLVAHRRRRHVQLLGRARDARQPSRGLEGAQRVQRRRRSTSRSVAVALEKINDRPANSRLSGTAPAPRLALMIGEEEKMIRRAAFLVASLCCIASAAFPAAAQPAQWPSKTVRVVLPHAPGGGTDLLARLIAERLRLAFGAAVHRGEPARCRNQHRHGHRGEAAGRRIHAARHDEHACHERGVLQAAALRPDQGLPAGLAHRDEPDADGGAGRLAGEDARGVRGARQVQAGRARLRQHRAGHAAASGRRHAGERRRHADDPRSVQGRRARWSMRCWATRSP